MEGGQVSVSHSLGEREEFDLQLTDGGVGHVTIAHEQQTEHEQRRARRNARQREWAVCTRSKETHQSCQSSIVSRPTCLVMRLHIQQAGG